MGKPGGSTCDPSGGALALIRYGNAPRTSAGAGLSRILSLRHGRGVSRLPAHWQLYSLCGGPTGWESGWPGHARP